MFKINQVWENSIPRRGIISRKFRGVEDNTSTKMVEGGLFLQLKAALQVISLILFLARTLTLLLTLHVITLITCSQWHEN